MTEVPRFNTDRLLLRGVSLGDIPAWEKHFIDYDVIRHLNAHILWPYPENGVQEFLQTNVLPHQGQDKWVWGIYLQQDPDAMIGVIDIWRPGSPDNRGFWLGKQFWGQGIMSEALAPVMSHAFTRLGFEKMIFSNATGNDRSRRIKEKAGACFLRCEPYAFVDPVYTEREIWELTKADWQAHP